MGYSLLLIAAQTIESDKVLNEFSMMQTGRHCYCAEEPLTGYALPSGWYLIAISRPEDHIYGSNEFARLSRLFPLIVCQIEEHEMFSSAEQWVGGSRVWQIVHDSKKGVADISKSGTLPASFEAIVAEAAKKQEAEAGEGAEGDYYFDIPILMIEEITGFRHDRIIEGIDCEHFDLLINKNAVRPGKQWWRFWR